MIGEMKYMREFEISPDCMIEKSADAIAKELLKGNFIVCCDYRNKYLVLENVLHYTEKHRRFEVYTLFTDKTNTRRCLRLENAIVFVRDNDIPKMISGFVNARIKEYDLYVIDKYKNLYTDIIYDKYGENMSLA